MSTLETWGPEDIPSQPQLSLIEGGEQNEQETIEAQATRALELIAEIEEAKRELADLPKEAVIHAAGHVIERHHATIRSGDSSEEAKNLGHLKDSVLSHLTEEERAAALFEAYDREHSRAA